MLMYLDHRRIMIDYVGLARAVAECTRGMSREVVRARPKAKARRVMKVAVRRRRIQRVTVEPVTEVQGKYISYSQL
jgi:hypothetical protein